MLIIPGGDALSARRAAEILRRARGCVAVAARFLHFAEVEGELDESQHAVLRELLRYGNAPSRGAAKATPKVTRVVTPRLGTISAWSSKATDILHRCGLRAVARVERGVEWQLTFRAKADAAVVNTAGIDSLIHDPMTESVLGARRDAAALFRRARPSPPAVIDLLGGGLAALEAADAQFGLALNHAERRYLLEQFARLGRNPTDVELMMFAQVNSEHCRHKIFNAGWRIGGRAMPHSLFAMIRATERMHGRGTLVAYDDNAAVLAGFTAERLQPNAARAYAYRREAAHFTAKVETHNHPTAISPHPGAATGAGGEIRDAAAAGRGGKPKAGVVGYAVSHLRVPRMRRPWEGRESRPARIASPLRIMLEAPLGAAAFNNEFGRPCIAGYFRTFEQAHGRELFAYHKPVMLAGGVGGIRPQHLRKRKIPDGAALVALGGPAMLIGLGGGAASSLESGRNLEALDFASVQRANAEMQRRCQEVIDACIALGADNPILSIHDVGAGGLSNALPELARDGGRGGVFELRDVPSAEPGMTPLQLWCNEAQERYVLALAPARWDEFEKICRRERCPAARVGRATKAQQLVARDRGAAAAPVNLPMQMLFGAPPPARREASAPAIVARKPLRVRRTPLLRAAKLVLGFPTVADKSFLVTICDRSVTGLVAREQMVGRWQVPVADAGVTASGHRARTGEAIALGERAPLALLDAAAGARMAAGEALTNIACARIGELGDIKFSANWMAAAGERGQDASLYRAVRALSRMCMQLGVSIPVGKDSLSMRVAWRAGGRARKAVAPPTAVVTAFAKVEDIGATLTPELARDDDNELWLLDLGRGKNRLGGSALAQVFAQLGEAPPDVGADGAKWLRNFFNCVQALSRRGLLLAYHDRSDGGLLACACEMAFAARCGLELDLGGVPGSPPAVLFNEELGAVLQTRASQRKLVEAEFRRHRLRACAHRIGRATGGGDIVIGAGGAVWMQAARAELHRAWSETGWRMQSLRDDPDCAAREYARISDEADPGLFSRVTFDHRASPGPAPALLHHRPKIAILREQGVNGQLEMAAAFDCAGFEAVDVAMSDLANGDSLANYCGFAACGGFSFGDVLGAGGGWAKSILHSARLRDMFAAFFARGDTFALGVCNGCQMMAALKELVPGAAHWPSFARNLSGRFEARTLMVEITSERSVLLRGMRGAMLPVASAHGEGRAEWSGKKDAVNVCLRFVDNHGAPAESYPANPNGSPGGATGFTNDDGRFTIMMPHPERVLRAVCNSWRPSGSDDWGEYAPWIRLFQNARAYAG
ncbi:MAG: phosphoribosylformylglycinamidine synthase [Gammaproteobacteria bacterium]|nr:phosphoribosylformylglycinamidine synthase [Gammaproteobacteria bacterium]